MLYMLCQRMFAQTWDMLQQRQKTCLRQWLRIKPCPAHRRTFMSGSCIMMPLLLLKFWYQKELLLVFSPRQKQTLEPCTNRLHHALGSTHPLRCTRKLKTSSSSTCGSTFKSRDAPSLLGVTKCHESRYPAPESSPLATAIAWRDGLLSHCHSRDLWSQLIWPSSVLAWRCSDWRSSSLAITSVMPPKKRPEFLRPWLHIIGSQLSLRKISR